MIDIHMREKNKCLHVKQVEAMTKYDLSVFDHLLQPGKCIRLNRM